MVLVRDNYRDKRLRVLINCMVKAIGDALFYLLHRKSQSLAVVIYSPCSRIKCIKLCFGMLRG